VNFGSVALCPRLMSGVLDHHALPGFFPLYFFVPHSRPPLYLGLTKPLCSDRHVPRVLYISSIETATLDLQRISVSISTFGDFSKLVG